MDLISRELLLKETDWDDLHSIHSLHSEPQVERYNSIGLPGSIEVTKAVIAGPIEDRSSRRRTQYEWTIRKHLMDDQEILGIIGLSLGPPRFQSAEVHYSLFPRYWGNGIAYAALQLVLRFGFADLRLHRIVAEVSTDNIRSINLLEKLGMQREGRGRQVIPVDGEWKDIYLYGILDDEY